MPLDIGDFDGRMELFQNAARTYLERVGSFDQADLDEIVIDAFSRAAMQAVNDGTSYNEAHYDAEARASEINNRGAEQQVTALMALGWTAEEIGCRLMDLPVEPGF